MILNSKPYLCSIPYVASAAGTSSTNVTETQEEHQQELVRASNHGWELLSGMRGNCIYYNAGWWVYSFCYDEGVKQFHRLPPGGSVPMYPPIEDPNVYSFMLGKFVSSTGASAGTSKQTKYVDGEAQQQPLSGAGDGATAEPESLATAHAAGRELGSELQTRGEANFLIQKLGHGTMCDLTGKPRSITVQFHCNPSAPDHIQMIKETSSCVYLMVVHTPRLCNDVVFLPPQVDKPNTIVCQEIVEKSGEKAWRAAAAVRAAEILTGSKKQKSDLLAEPISIGGIQVGGKKLVGESPERSIKPSNIVKPAKQQQQDRSSKEKYVATIAKSDGKYTSVMSPRGIKKVGVKASTEEIEGLIDDIENWAGEGTPWRLEVVEVNGKFEYRGIQDDAEDELVGDAEVERSGKDGDRDTAGSREEYKT